MRTLKTVGFDGEETSRGVEGELWVRGPQRCKGYVDSTLDAEAFDDDGFFRTGDLGIVDEDGFVRITGRLKDIIIRNAENLSAQEIEDVLSEHPAVADVAVIGVPDERTGERACAIVVLAPGSESISIPELAEHCAAKGLAKQKIPEQLEIVTELPRNPMGKVLKHVLRARDRRGGLTTMATASAPDLWEVMRTARAIRRFTERPVDDALLATCLEAATWAPSGGNQQPWHFVVMRSAAAREALDDRRRPRAGGHREGLPALSPGARRRHAARPQRTRHVRAARRSCRRPCGGAVLRSRPARARRRWRSAVRSSRRCRTSSSPSEPRASGRASPAGTWTPRPSSVSALDVPDEWQLAGLVIVGWPAGKHGPLRRRPVREVASLDRWGQPLDR